MHCGVSPTRIEPATYKTEIKVLLQLNSPLPRPCPAEADYIASHMSLLPLSSWELEGKVSPSLSRNYSHTPSQLCPLLPPNPFKALLVDFCFGFALNLCYLSWCVSLRSSSHSSPNHHLEFKGSVGFILVEPTAFVGCAHRMGSTDTVCVSLKRRNGGMKRTGKGKI